MISMHNPYESATRINKYKLILLHTTELMNEIIRYPSSHPRLWKDSCFYSTLTAHGEETGLLKRISKHWLQLCKHTNLPPAITFLEWRDVRVRRKIYLTEPPENVSASLFRRRLEQKNTATILNHIWFSDQRRCSQEYQSLSLLV